jgi:formylglycine-generating enzyme required for sulfatase activity
MMTQILPTAPDLIAEALEKLIDMASDDRPPPFRDLVKAAGLDPERDFVGASLRDLDFRDEDLRGFDFSEADLTGADFRRANVTGVSFSGADLTGTIGLIGARNFDADGSALRLVRLPRDFDAAPQMIVVRAGEFMMGSPAGEGDDNERPQHKVTIKSAFAVGISPITRGDFASFIDATNYKVDERSNLSWRNPGFNQEDDHPVVCVNWHDAQAYVAWLRERSGGKAYRLLSEAEWEYCCRAGTTSEYSTGDTITAEHANFGGNAKGTTSVFRFPPNPWGLRDMHGNVWEWCEDNWHKDYKGNPPSDGSVWRGGETSSRVLRGGTWSGSPQNLRSANRRAYLLGGRIYYVGFRVARTL